MTPPPPTPQPPNPTLSAFRAALVELFRCPECLGGLTGDEVWLCEVCGYDVAEEVIGEERDG